jgi:arylsulfatase A-like enzyme
MPSNNGPLKNLSGQEGEAWFGPRGALPNLVLVSMDAVGAGHLSLYSYDRPTTPYLQELARKGLVFNQAIANSCWTLPSHASLLTGRDPFGHGASFRYSRLREGLPTLAQIVKMKGYATAAFVSAPYLMARYGLNRGFDTYNDRMPVKEKRTAAEVNQAAWAWLKDHHQRPFFIFLHYFDAHTPYLPPKPFQDLYDTAYTGEMTGETFANGEQVMKEGGQLSEADRRHLVALYDGAITYEDEQIGLFLKKLSSLGHSEDTLVVITADHGEAFGEHGFYLHGHGLYEELIKIPLILFDPQGRGAGRTLSHQVSLADILPTLCDFMGLAIPEGSQGKSQLPYLRDAVPAEDPVYLYVDRFPMLIKKYGPRFDQDLWALRTETWKYIFSSTGRQELYHLKEDPGEKINLAEHLPQQSAYFHQELQTAIGETDRSFKESKPWFSSLFSQKKP